MNIVEAIHAAEAGPAVAIRIVGNPLATWSMFPLRLAGRTWESFDGDGDWSPVFGDPLLSFTVNDVLEEWEAVPVADVEMA